LVLLITLAIVSIGANLFIVGSWLGWQLHRAGPFEDRGPPGPPPGGMGDRGAPRGPEDLESRLRLNIMLEGMSEADQKTARDVLHEHESELGEKWAATRGASQAVTAALHSEPFDADAARAAFAKLNESGEQFRLLLQAMLIEVAQKVSPEGRAHLKLRGPP
jgi:uncharacterized membrane protein